MIAQQPDSISLSGNLKPFIVTGVNAVSFVLKHNDTELINEQYTASDGKVIVDIKNIVNSQLGLTLPDYNTMLHTQSRAKKTFIALLDGQTVEFTVVRGGVESLAESCSDFLAYNFLTWQPQAKEITVRQPEWLTYYAGVDCKFTIRAYFADETNKILSIPLSVGNVYTVKTNYDFINEFFGLSLAVSYYDVWIEAGDNRLTYIQRYIPIPEPAIAEFYVFENTLGGIDTLLCSGERVEKIKVTADLATIRDTTIASSADYSVGFEQNTGILTRDAARWLRDLFVSPQQFHVSDTVRGIYIEEQDNDVSNVELNSYTFLYYYSNQTHYNKVIRNREQLPALLEFPTPDGLFFLTPRLSEYPTAKVDDNLIIPVQNPYSGTWMKIAASILCGGGSGDGVTKEWVTKNFWSRLELLFHDLVKVDKQGNVAIPGSLALKEILFSGLKTETGTSLALTDTAGENNVVVQMLKLVASNFQTPDFLPGFQGAGIGTVNGTDLHADNILVRKVFTVIELLVQRIRHQGGQTIFSPAAIKCSEMISDPAGYKCRFETGGVLGNEFRVGDQARCQTFSGDAVKYYWRVVTAVGDDYIVLSATEADGTGIPAPGDEIVQLGNLTDTTRQSAIIISAAGVDSPGIDLLDGINSFSLSGKVKARLGKKDGKMGVYVNEGRFENVVIGKGCTGLQSFDDYTEAKKDISDGIQVGGVNLLDGSDYVTNREAWNALPAVQEGDGIKFVRYGYAWSFSAYLKGFKKNNTYTWSGLFRSHDGGTIARISMFGEKKQIFLTGINAQWQRLSITFKLDVDPVGITYFLCGSSNTIDFAEMQIEEGNKSTAWSPSLEDQKKAVQDVKNLVQTITDDDVFSSTEKKQLLPEWNNILNEKTDLDSNAVKYAVTAEKNAYQAAYTALFNYVNPLMVKLNTNSPGDGAVFAGTTFRDLFSDFYKKRTALQNKLTATAKQYVDDIQVGGTNYLNGSRFDTTDGWILYGGTVNAVVDEKYGKVVEFSRPGGGGDFQKRFDLPKAELTNTELVYYIIAKQIGEGGSWQFGGWNVTYAILNTGSSKINLGGGWYQYWATFKSGDTLGDSYFGINSIRGTWRFYAAGVLKGNKATAWSPSLADVEAKINNTQDTFAKNLGYTGIQDMLTQAETKGSLVVKGLLNADLISAKTLVVQDAFITTLMGQHLNFQTGTIGKFIFDEDSLYCGLKAGLNQFSTSGFTLSSKGYLSHPKFLLKTDGNAIFRGDLDGVTGSFTSLIVGSGVTDANGVYTGDVIRFSNQGIINRFLPNIRVDATYRTTLLVDAKSVELHNRSAIHAKLSTNSLYNSYAIRAEGGVYADTLSVGVKVITSETTIPDNISVALFQYTSPQTVRLPTNGKDGTLLFLGLNNRSQVEVTYTNAANYTQTLALRAVGEFMVFARAAGYWNLIGRRTT